MIILVCFLALKIYFFCVLFFSYKLPRKCLGFFFRFMVTLLTRLFKMGCWFSKGSKDRDMKKHRAAQTASSSGHPYQSTGNRQKSDSQYYEGQKQIKNAQSAAQKIVTQPLDIPSSQENWAKDSVEVSDSSVSFTVGPKQSSRGESPPNVSSTRVYQINEDRRSPIIKDHLRPVNSLPAKRIDKMQVNNQYVCSPRFVSSYDSTLRWNSSTSRYESKSGYPNPHVDISRGSNLDTFNRNAYTVFGQNKPKGNAMLEEKVYKTSGPQLAKSEILEQHLQRQYLDTSMSKTWSDASETNFDNVKYTGNMDQPMETDHSLKRDTQHLELDKGDLGRGDFVKTAESLNKRIKKTPLDAEHPSNETIMSELERRIRSRYSKDLARRENHNFCLEVCTLKESGEIQRRFSSLSQLFPYMPKWKILLYGKPFFGKSELCRDVTAEWLSTTTEKIGKDFANIRNFKILVYDSLKPANVSDLKKYFIDDHYELLPKDFVTKSVFEDAWKGYMVDTLFILDGYHELDSDNKRRVNVTLRQNFFQDASILLTCRPDADFELRTFFNIRADICGLGQQFLSELTKNIKSDSFSKFNLNELVGLSPLYAQAVVDVFRNGETPASLYDLLHSVITSVAKTVNLDERTFDNIGITFLEGLKCRQFVFEQEKLLLLEKSWIGLESLGLFVGCPTKPNKTKKLIVSHKLFMLYFSVRYLRKSWRFQTLSAQHETFLKSLLCLGDSSGVYLGTVGTPSKVIFVGTIPEIIFDVQNSVFQMIQDVAELDVTSAFETRSLLSRVDSNCLPIFGITEVENPDVENCFGEILNLLDFWGITIESTFFVTDNSPLYYLKIAAVDEETDRLVMLSVVSVNPQNGCKTQEVFLDFLGSDVKVLHLFLQKFVEMFYGVREIDLNIPAVDLVFRLVSLGLALRCNLYTQLTLGSTSLSPSALVTWEINSSSCGDTSSAFLYGKESETVMRNFNSESCRLLTGEPNRSKIIRKMNETVRELPELGITVLIKSKF